MYKEKKVLAIIPARGGSKGIPRKNIKMMAGKPLVYYTIKSANNSLHLDKIVLSTEDHEIANIARSFDIDVIIRPEELAKDETPTIPVMKHSIERMEEKGENFDIIVLLQPTSPLREGKDIDDMIEILVQSKADSVVSVTQSVHPIDWLFELRNDNKLKRYLDRKTVDRRQDLAPLYLPNGSIYAVHRDKLYENDSIFGPDTMGYMMPPERSIDIDSELDWIIAERLLEERENLEKEKRKADIIVGNRIIGKNQNTFIIAEAGVNHNGDIKKARSLIDAAAKAGVDAVKFQTFTAEKVLSKTAEKAEYQKVATGNEGTQFDMIKPLELDVEAHFELSRYTKEKGLIFLSSPFDRDSVDLLEKLEIPAYKIPSGEITNGPLLYYIASKLKPVIMSTGMSNLEEVRNGIEVLRSGGCSEIILLHCVSNYPTRTEDVNLRAMRLLEKEFGFHVGYSDHTLGLEATLAGVALGAKVIEKHFTLDKNLPGPDHKASLEPFELKQMVSKIRKVEKMLGHGKKVPCESEFDVREVARKSLVAVTDIPKGVILEESMITAKRPGTGISPMELEQLLKRKAKLHILEDTILEWEMFEK